MSDGSPGAERGTGPERPRTGRTGRVGHFFVVRRRWIVAAWLVGLVAVFAASSQLAGEWEADYSTPGSESELAASLIAERFGDAGSGGTIDVVWTAPGGVRGGEAGREMTAYLDGAAELEGIVAAEQPRYSQDGTIAMSSLTLDRREWDVPVETAEALLDEAERLNAAGALRVELAGGIIQEAREAASPEVIGLAAALLILLIAFGSVVAAGLPLMTAIFGLGLATALIGILAAVLPVPNWATAVTALIGIALGIDYTLLILTRFRAAIGRGKDVHDAIGESLSTAGRSVLVAGITVIIALGGLLLMRMSFMTGVAFAAMIAVLAAMGAALTLVPAALAMAGRRVDRLRIPGLGRGAWGETGPLAARWSRGVQRRPLIAATIAIAVLLALSAPALDMRLGFSDFGSDPEGTTTREAYDLAAEGFGEGAGGPLLVAVDLAGVPGATAGSGGDAAGVTAGSGARAAESGLEPAAAALGEIDGVASVTPPELAPGGDAALITIFPEGSPQD
ncbi:MAG TPA: MMPL family transporter, partial [Solirubrobacterales bacterium]|nr:MMPL family transporter [Solirubrobacterales bacterium]